MSQIDNAQGAAAANGEEKKAEEPHNMMVVPKFLSGLRIEVKTNIFYLNDNTVLYPVGHNIVILNTEEKTQRYIPGIDGSEGITAVAVSASKKYLAVSERTDKAPVCQIYNLDSLKKLKTITSSEIPQREFISIAFSPTNEKMLVTLTEPFDQQQVFIWQWDKPKCIAYQFLTLTAGNALGTQVSFCNADHQQILVTGNNTFKFFKLHDSLSLKPSPIGMQKKEQHISSNYTAHCWLPDHKILVGTDQGDIIVCDTDVGCRSVLNQDNPIEGYYINCIRTYMKGFLVGGSNGTILVFEKTDDPKNPYTRVAKLPLDVPDMIEGKGQGNAMGKMNNQQSSGEGSRNKPHVMRAVRESKIQWMDLSKLEEWIIFSTESSQLFRMKLNLERPTDGAEYEYLVYPFHNRQINGLDVCVSKNLIATCGQDKTVKIWSYSPNLGFNLEINYEQRDETSNKQEGEEALSVAFHPSGFHVVVGFSEKIRMMNLFQDQLIEYRSIQIKQCREISFSNGGHLFAAVQGTQIHVFKFYTAENPPHYIFKSHVGIVSCIAWFEDDSGFVSTGWDSAIYVWKLDLAKPHEQIEESKADHTGKDQPKEQNPVWEHKFKNLQVTSVVPYKEDIGAPLQMYMTVKDKSLREFVQGHPLNFKSITEKLRLEQECQTGPVCVMAKRKGIFMGTTDQSKPGAIQCLKYPFEKTYECQAHSQPVVRMRLSYDNSTLFSVSVDGSFGVFSIQDKDPKRKIKDLPSIQHSGVLLIQRTEHEKTLHDIEHYQQEIKAYKEMAKVDAESKRNQQEKKINELDDEIETKQIEASNKYESLMDQKREVELDYMERIKLMREQHEEELERRIKDQQEKINADQQRYMDLLQAKEQQCQRFEILLTEIFEQHTALLEKMHRDHQLEKDALEERKKQLAQHIEVMITEHQKVKMEVENYSWERIDRLKERQKEELAKEIDKGMQQKSDLSIIVTEYRGFRAKKEQQNKTISNQNDELQRLMNEANNQRSEIKAKESELRERDQTIAGKQIQISQLKQKTQDLEKFKFVLDYKIKELKREIKPRESIIQQLFEQTTKMEQEVKFFQRVNTNLILIVADLEMRSRGLSNEKTKLSNRMQAQNDLIRRYKEDTNQILQLHIHDYGKLKKEIVRLYKTYSAPSDDLQDKEEDAGDKRQGIEFEQFKKNKEENEHLEQNLRQVRTNLGKMVKQHRSKYNKIQKENIMLLKELNALRKEQQSQIQILLKRPKNEGQMSQAELQQERMTLEEQLESTDQQIQLMQQQQQEFEANLETLRRMVAENARGDAHLDVIEGGHMGEEDVPNNQAMIQGPADDQAQDLGQPEEGEAQEPAEVM